jgi:hypothetical protein
MALVGVRIEGGLIAQELLDQVARGEAPGQATVDFGLEARARLLDEIARDWSDARDYWSVFKRRQERLSGSDPHGTTLTRQQWVGRLLDELFGYDLALLKSAPILNGHAYPISHRGGLGDTDPPVHVVGFKVDLDHRDPEAGRRLSPQALVQEYLNRSEDLLWGVVTNGLQLRLLRDTARTTKPTYIEFDLAGILDGDRFDEFAIFYRLCHRTRLPRGGQPSDACWLERYYQESIEQGGRVREKLRDGVKEALEALGTGFLRHPRNGDLAKKVRAGKLSPADLYRQLLGLVYRLLFLMVAEERGMVRAAADGADRRQKIYDAYYSVTRLRKRAASIIERSSFGDLWVGLRRSFAMLAGGGAEDSLGIPPLNGDLFKPDVLCDLLSAELHNDDLLLAIRKLSLFRAEGVLRPVNYEDLGVEELGSVYESLLEEHPTVVDRNGPAFELATGGSEKKKTGSYYTRPELVRELVKSALLPMIEDRLAAATTPQAREQALLSLSVCDPACGSGHFLLAAARQLGRELAKIRTGEEEPTPDEFRRAVRDVIQHCVYGVDLNPLAVDLCKLALWIEGHNTGRPLTFLDHRIRCGNSLVGLFSLDVLRDGIPDEAFNPVFGDEKSVASVIRRRNSTERKAGGTQVQLRAEAAPQDFVDLAAAHDAIADLPEATVVDVHEKERRYLAIRGEGSSWWTDWTAANLWTAAFFMPISAAGAGLIATIRDLRAYFEGHGDSSKVAAANRLGLDLRFFHWPLEFPEVFARGGFDVVLGNPPWERIKLQEDEFFAVRNPQIAEAPGKADRDRLIKELPKKNPTLYHEYASAKHVAEAQSKYVRACGRYPLTAVGDINTFALFAELGRSLAGPAGSSGLVVPTGIGTDDTCKDFFGHLVTQRELESLYDFENRRGLFPSVDSRYKFCLLTMNRRPVELAKFAFFLHRAEDLTDDRRRFSMPPGDLMLFNPNTRTLPLFRTKADVELTKSIYSRIPVFVNERTGSNSWGVQFRRLFDMNKPKVLALCEFGTKSRGSTWLPMFESKVFHQYDHRWATYEAVNPRALDAGKPRLCSVTEKRSPEFRITPRWWVPEREVKHRLMSLWEFDWVIAFRDIARATDERTMVATILPKVGTDFTVRLGFPQAPVQMVGCLLANLNSLALDYCARQSVGGIHLADFVTKQLPVLPQDAYAKSDISFITQRVLELIFVSDALSQFALAIGYCQSPFPFDIRRRSTLVAELDAYFFHMYGLARDEVRYILDPHDVHGDDFPGETFRVLKERETREYGEYRTRRLVLAAYDDLAKTSRFGSRVSVSMPTTLRDQRSDRGES